MAAGQKQVGGTLPDRAHHRSFVLRAWLAQGGMAELYLAHRPGAKLGDPVVVVKRVLPYLSQDTRFTQMFSREVEVASKFNHENLIQVYEAGGIGEPDSFFVMEYVHGPDLREILNRLATRRQRVPLQQALHIAMAMCRGLDHAHEQRAEDGTPLGIVHRDVSPSNVLISFDGDIKITDFGVAKALALTSFTQQGTRKGKLSYMSPEQARGDDIDRTADIFAIGAVLYEMTTGTRMFKGDNELAIMHSLLFTAPTPPSDLLAGFPPELEAIIMKATAHERAQRFQTALEMAQALLTFATSVGAMPSRANLGRFVASLVPRTPHPGSNPDFFEDRPFDHESVRQDAETNIDSIRTLAWEGSANGSATSIDAQTPAPPDRSDPDEGGSPGSVNLGFGPPPPDRHAPSTADEMHVAKATPSLPLQDGSSSWGRPVPGRSAWQRPGIWVALVAVTIMAGLSFGMWIGRRAPVRPAAAPPRTAPPPPAGATVAPAPEPRQPIAPAGTAQMPKPRPSPAPREADDDAIIIEDDDGLSADHTAILDTVSPSHSSPSRSRTKRQRKPKAKTIPTPSATAPPKPEAAPTESDSDRKQENEPAADPTIRPLSSDKLIPIAPN